MIKQENVLINWYPYDNHYTFGLIIIELNNKSKSISYS